MSESLPPTSDLPSRPRGPQSGATNGSRAQGERRVLRGGWVGTLEARAPRTFRGGPG